MKTWFTITNVASAPAAEIDIFDEIGMWGVSTKDFATALKAVSADREIIVRINSPGGSVIEGFAIYSLLAERREKVTAKIIGLAASMASVIALAGKRTIAVENATVMIHNPAAVAIGDSADMREMANVLDKFQGNLVNAYVTKTGKPEADVKAAMDATTWFTAQEAKDWGLVDEVIGAVKIAASFDLTRFGDLPQKISGGPSASINEPKPTVMNTLIKALVDAKLVASADVSEDTAVAQFGAAFAAQANANKDLTDANAALQTKLDEANAKISANLKASAEAAVVAAAKSGRIKDDAALNAKWVTAYQNDPEGTKAMLDSLPEAKAPRGVAPVAVQPQVEPKAEPELKGLARVEAVFKAEAAARAALRAAN